MPRLADYRTALTTLGPWTFCRNLYNEISEDGILTWAAALAYSWMFALFPLIIFLLTLVAFLPINPDRSVEEVNRVIRTSLPGQASEILTDQVPTILKNQQSGLLTLGALLTLWAASGGMAATMSALNRCYDIVEDAPFYVARPKAILLTLACLILILIVLALLPVGGLILAWLKSQGGASLSTPVEWAIDFARWAISFTLLLLVVALIYYFGPRLKSGFRFVTPGGFFTVLAWIALGFAFKTYITSFGEGYNQTYGAVGGAVILLLFLYCASLVLLIGAEINSEFDFAIFGRTGALADKPNFTSSRAADPADTTPETSPATAPLTTGAPAPTPPHSKPQVPAFSHPHHPPHPHPTPPPAPTPPRQLSLPAAASLAGLALLTGYLLKRPPSPYQPPLTSRRRLPKVYPLTYAALKPPV